jgi:hypothetical protein
MSHPIFTFIGQDGVTPESGQALANLQAAVDAINFPWDKLLTRMALPMGDYIQTYVDPVTGLVGVPNADSQANQWSARTHINVQYADSTWIRPGVLSQSNPLACMIAIHQNYAGDAATTAFLVAYEMGHVVDAQWFRYNNAARMQLRQIMGNPGLGWMTPYQYATNIGGFGMAFASGYPMVADSTHAYPYPPSEVWRIPIIMGLADAPEYAAAPVPVSGALPSSVLIHVTH